MITTSREAIRALDIFHQSVAEVMIARGSLALVDDTEEEAPPHQSATRTRRDRQEV